MFVKSTENFPLRGVVQLCIYKVTILAYAEDAVTYSTMVSCSKANIRRRGLCLILRRGTETTPAIEPLRQLDSSLEEVLILVSPCLRGFLH
jgi:hypothetical protein